MSEFVNNKVELSSDNSDNSSDSRTINLSR